jgi:hypothetical protein
MKIKNSNRITVRKIDVPPGTITKEQLDKVIKEIIAEKPELAKEEMADCLQREITLRLQMVN